LVDASEKWQAGTLSQSDVKLSAGSFQATAQQVSEALSKGDHDSIVLGAIKAVNQNCGELAGTVVFASAGAGVFGDTLPSSIQACSTALDSLDSVVGS